MKLTSYIVSHYKSLSGVKVDFHPKVTVIVGPNSVGKSNFVDSMRFLRDAAKDDLDHAIVSRGGITRIRQQITGSGRPFNLSLGVETTQQFTDHSPESASYALEITSLKGGEYKIEYEEAVCSEEHDEFDIDDDHRTRVLVNDGFQRNRDGQVKLTNEVLGKKFSFEDQDQLVLGSRHGGFGFRSLADELDKYFSNWKFTTLYPTTLRELKAPDSEIALREDGSNWASVVRAAKKTAKGRQNLERINEMMRLVLPDFLDMTITTAGSYLVPNFKFGEAGNKTTHRVFDPVQLSDGTLRIYGILLSLYQTPSPPLLVIEEPEQTVHPGVLAMLAEAFKEVSERTQIIVTTHSPQLVDHFEPENIRVATMINGETKIAPIKKSQQLAVQQGLIGLGEFMAAEGLYPELPL